MSRFFSFLAILAILVCLRAVPLAAQDDGDQRMTEDSPPAVPAEQAPAEPPKEGDPGFVGPVKPPPKEGDPDFVGPPRPPDKPAKPDDGKPSEKSQKDAAGDKRALNDFGNFLGNAAGGVASSWIGSQQRQAANAPRTNLEGYNGRSTTGANLNKFRNIDGPRENSAISKAQQVYQPFNVSEFNERTNEHAELANRIANENQVNARAIDGELKADTQKAAAITNAVGGIAGGSLSSFIGGGTKQIFTGLFSSFAGGNKSTKATPATKPKSSDGGSALGDPNKPAKPTDEGDLTGDASKNKDAGQDLAGKPPPKEGDPDFVGPPSPPAEDPPQAEDPPTSEDPPSSGNEVPDP